MLNGEIMKFEDSHLSDPDLLLDVDGELSAHDATLVRTHLDGCWKCRARRSDLEQAIADLIRVHPRELGAALPSAAGPRALLKAQLAQLSAAQGSVRSALAPRHGWPLAVGALGACACMIMAIAFYFAHPGRGHGSSRVVIVSFPDSTLTPGAAVLESRQAVCAQPGPKNKDVPVALQQKVFREYGITEAGPHAYEVDYLITPALGGADDIHNLWPHSYSATVWNAEVKDALEDRLRSMVCEGDLDLTEAQQEIAQNWIAAYKKYFHTDTPIPEHP
jgi:hypothetical protein